MKTQETTSGSVPERNIERAEREAMLKASTARQQLEIQSLHAQNRARSSENIELKLAANSDRREIDILKANRDSLELLVVELRKTQQHNETLNLNLQARNKALESLNKELESFSYAVSHDLRSPLRSIFGFGEALKQSASDKLTAEEKQWLGKILAAALRMDVLTEDLLRLSRLTRAQLERKSVDLVPIARDVISELRQNDPLRNVSVAIPDEIVVQADPALMRVVMTNLLGNAWKYTGRRDEAVISVSVEDQQDTCICVRDNGAGFEMAYAAKLFAPFQRLHSARDFPGSGVGLACVARVIHKHGGRVWAQAEPDKGAAFFFTVPGNAEVAEQADMNS